MTSASLAARTVEAAHSEIEPPGAFPGNADSGDQNEDQHHHRQPQEHPRDHSETSVIHPSRNQARDQSDAAPNELHEKVACPFLGRRRAHAGTVEHDQSQREQCADTNDQQGGGNLHAIALPKAAVSDNIIFTLS